MIDKNHQGRDLARPRQHQGVSQETRSIDIALDPFLVPAREGRFLRGLMPQPEAPIKRGGDINIERIEKSDPSNKYACV